MSKSIATTIENANDTRVVLNKEATIPALPESVTSDEQAAGLTSQIQDVEARIDRWVDRLAGPKKKAHDAWKEWTKLESDICGPAKAFATRAREMLTDYMRRKRIEAETIAKAAEKAQRDADDARALADAEALQAMADETGDKSYAEMADAVLDAVPETVTVAPEKVAPITGMKSAGARKVVVVKNLRLLCAEIGLGKVPEDVIKDVDMKALTLYVKASGRLPAGVETDTADRIAIEKKKA